MRLRPTSANTVSAADRLALLGTLALVLLGTAALVTAQGVPLANVDTTGGQQVFAANCTACHQVTGAGIPAVFPPLAEHVPELLAVEGGRHYLAAVVLFGLTGPIAVAGQAYDGLMPPWGHLSDAQLADVLNYVASAWGNHLVLPQGFVAFTAEEVLGIRGDALDSNAVHAVRQTLELE